MPTPYAPSLTNQATRLQDGGNTVGLLTGAAEGLVRGLRGPCKVAKERPKRRPMGLP